MFNKSEWYEERVSIFCRFCVIVGSDTQLPVERVVLQRWQSSISALHLQKRRLCAHMRRCMPEHLDQLLIASVMGPDPLERLHVSLINTATALAAVPSHQHTERRARPAGGNQENQGCQTQTAEEQLAGRETGGQTQRETLGETRGDSVKESESTTSRGDGSICASPDVLFGNRVRRVLLNSLQCCCEGPD